MRELSLLLLLLLPNWSILNAPRESLTNFTKANSQKIVEEIKTEPLISGPYKNSEAVYQSSAKSVYSVDMKSNLVLSDFNSTEKLSVASLTKLVTAYVYLKDNKNLDEVVKIPSYVTQTGDALMGIYPDESISKKDLLTGMLISSGSDAASSLAILDAGSINDFVSKMNKTVGDLGLTNSNFTNPVGWDENGNYSTAKDIAEISRILLRNTFFAETVATKNKTVYTLSGRAINLSNTNILLDGSKYFGIKTGYTLAAGECLAALKKQENKEVLTVILGANNRFAETDELNSWISTHYLW